MKLRSFDIARAASFLSNARHARRMGAALFSGATLLSIGFNEYGKTHPRAKNGHCNIHAEHRALIKRQYYKNGGRLAIYVYRETSDGKPACSKPCGNCRNLLREAGISVVHFVDESGAYGLERI